jgi:hypothetical protein
MAGDNKEVTCFRFDPALKERFRVICKKERRTISQMVAIVVEEFVENWEKKNQKKPRSN